jgi:hypothetical protein
MTLTATIPGPALANAGETSLPASAAGEGNCQIRSYGPAHHGVARKRLRNCAGPEARTAAASNCQRADFGPRQRIGRTTSPDCARTDAERATTYSAGRP